MTSQKKTDNEDLFIDAVTQGKNTNDAEQVFADVHVCQNKTAVSFKLDTGASANVIPTRFQKTGNSACTTALYSPTLWLWR